MKIRSFFTRLESFLSIEYSEKTNLAEAENHNLQSWDLSELAFRKKLEFDS
jgi:hypothetical protein